MKKVTCIVAYLSLFCCAFAEDEHGVYIGAGAAAAERDTYFTLKHVPIFGYNNTISYTVPFSDRATKCNGQLFAGYQYASSSLFLAFEINYLLNNSKVQKNLTTEFAAWHEMRGNSANVSIKRKNELYLLLKIGRHLCYNITPYAICGFGVHNMECDFAYVPPGDDDGTVHKYLLEPRIFKKRSTKLTYGAGVSFALEHNFNFRIEYTCYKFGELRYSETLGKVASKVNGRFWDVIDVKGTPRYYSFKTKMQKNISFGISRSITW